LVEAKKLAQLISNPALTMLLNASGLDTVRVANQLTFQARKPKN
jgi:hypothetical protein